jgi:hypothetical protein
MVGTLGEIFVPSPGTAVQITKNQADPTKYIAARTVSFQVLPGNNGIVYIGLQHMDAQGTGARSELLAILPKPTSATTGPFTTVTIGQDTVVPSSFDLTSFYVDAINANDGVLVTYTNQ